MYNIEKKVRLEHVEPAILNSITDSFISRASIGEGATMPVDFSCMTVSNLLEYVQAPLSEIENVRLRRKSTA